MKKNRNGKTFNKSFLPMLPLASKQLADTVQQQLDDLQQKVNTELSFADRAAKAQLLWNSKGGKKGKEAFDHIKKELYNLCVYKGVCNYCEHSEANDIEHIYPKSFFPEKAFVWDNYLLACKQCNSAYKLDKCYVLNDSGEVVDVERGQEPAYKELAFLNPRLPSDNPNDYMLLDLQTFTFVLRPELNTAHTNKANKTIEILQLNSRDTLLRARKDTARYCYEQMERLTKILNTRTIAELETLLTPYDDRLDKNLPLSTLQKEIKESYQVHLSTFMHPSVWHSIKTIESKVSPKWKAIFNRIPEALHW